MITEKHIIDPNRPTLYFITGIPGSGKSTFAKKMAKEKGILNHFEADHWMIDSQGNYSFDPKKLSFCHYQCQKYTRLAMEVGEDVIVSNTSLTKKEAKPYFDLAKNFQYNIELFHLQSSYGSIHSVPSDKIEQMKKKREFFKISDSL
jgi:predicted kinase